MGGIELPQTIKLIAGGSVQGMISFKAKWIYKKPLYGNLFDSSSSEYEEDPGMKPAMLTNLTADNQVEAQYRGTNSDSGSSCYALEDMSNKPLMEILLTGTDEDSGATIPHRQSWNPINNMSGE